MLNYCQNAVRDIQRAADRDGVAEFARKASVNRKSVESWIAGKSYPRADKLGRIAKAIGCEVWELFPRPNDTPYSQLTASQQQLKTLVAKVPDIHAPLVYSVLLGVFKTHPQLVGLLDSKEKKAP